MPDFVAWLLINGFEDGSVFNVPPRYKDKYYINFKDSYSISVYIDLEKVFVYSRELPFAANARVHTPTTFSEAKDIITRIILDHE